MLWTSKKKGILNMGCLIVSLILSIPSLLTFFIAILCDVSFDKLLMLEIVVNAIFIFSSMIIEGCTKVNNKEDIDSMIEQQKEQEKYDNDWGIIDSNTKK